MNKTLYLPLKKEWYELIESGVKTEEYRKIKPYCADTNEENKLYPSYFRLWKERIYGDRSLEEASLRVAGNMNMYSVQYCYKDKVLQTITSKQDGTISFYKPSFLSDREVTIDSSFPLDFNYLGSRANYVCGMSVPPIMMAQLASRVYEEWLSKI